MLNIFHVQFDFFDLFLLHLKLDSFTLVNLIYLNYLNWFLSTCYNGKYFLNKGSKYIYDMDFVSRIVFI
jgi:hypothetical protein